MSTYRINGIKYNPANWAGLDPAERAACNRFAAARERELNTITATAWKCQGGPFNGHPVELESTTDRTAPMNVGAWAGHYELQTDPEHVKNHGRPSVASQAPRVLVWVGNDGGQAINTHHHTTTEKKAGADVTARGFDQLRDLLADLAEDPTERATSSPLGPRARYTIGRTTYTIAATAEAADRLRARILKAKRWFSDKLLSAPAPAPAPDQHAEAAPGAPAIIAASVAIATAQASSVTTEQPETTDESAEPVTCDGPELVDTAAAVADTPQAGGDAIGADHTPTEADPADCTDPRETRAQAGGYTQAHETLRADYLRAAEAGHTQQAGSKRGAWSAVMFRTADGRAGLAFKRPGQPVELAELATGGERMRALQAMAQAAEQAHQQQAQQDTQQAGAAQGADCTQAPETLAPDCTTPHETPAGAGALSIRLERWEGLVDGCRLPETVGSFAEADAVLLRWSETAPEHGGYDKCGFVITWPDGDTYTGRFDLVNHRRERPSLRDHISGPAEFWLGTGCPMHMGEQEYHQAISGATDETRAQWSTVLDLLRLHAAYFPRQQPISCPDLRALADHLKIEPAELVGLGVTTYKPSERNLQRGAITEAETVEGRWSGAAQLLAVVTYEDGTREHIEADAFKDHNNHRNTRRRLNLQRHGAPYLAQLAAAAAAQKAAASSAAERKQQAEKKARADLLEQFAHLERGGGCVVAARNMRILLKAAYPSVKFSVKTQQYTGGNNITVSWTDGPTDEAVGAIVNRFKHGSFNGMDDSYDFNRDPFTELFGGCYYLHANRDESPELIERALLQHFPNAETRPSVQDWQNSRGVFDWRDSATSQHADAYRAEFRRTLAGIDATPPAKTTRKGAKA